MKLIFSIALFVLGHARKRFAPAFKAEDDVDHPSNNKQRGTLDFVDGPWDESTAQAHQVVDLPMLPFGYSADMYAGRVGVYEDTLQNKGSLFYWLVESQATPATDPLVVWFNGGPGCSSLEGFLIEHGPFRASGNGFGLSMNLWSWNRRANVLYIDQPVGTGFASVVDGEYAMSQNDVDVHFMAFFKNWMKMFPQYNGRQFIMTGESYAGRYIPRFAKLILEDDTIDLNFDGVMIGNGWTHPITQSAIMPAYAEAHGIISTQQRQILEQVMDVCRVKYAQDPHALETWEACELIQAAIPRMSGNPQTGVVNVYDVRLYDTSAGREWPWRSSGEVTFLRNPRVREALHAPRAPHDKEWTECSDIVLKYLTHEDMYSTMDELNFLISHTRVLLYAGQFDFICNHMGTEAFLDEMEWEGKEDFTDPWKRGMWMAGSQQAGYVKQGGNLTFVTVLGGSHMVPVDKPMEMYEMISLFLDHQPFVDKTFGDIMPKVRLDPSAPPPILTMQIPINDRDPIANAPNALPHPTEAATIGNARRTEGATNATSEGAGTSWMTGILLLGGGMLMGAGLSRANFSFRKEYDSI